MSRKKSKKKSPVTMTDAELQSIMTSYQDLLDKAHKQLAEYKIALKINIQEYTHHHPVSNLEVLLAQCEEIALEFVNVDELVKKDKNAKRITAVFVFPDELHAFLTQDSVPKELSLTKQGGITVEPEPAVVA